MAVVKESTDLNHGIECLSLEEQLSRFPDELLDKQCTDLHLVKLTGSFSEWQGAIATGLGLTLVDIHDIETAWPREPVRQRVEMFRRWKKVMNEKTTYRYVCKCYNITTSKYPKINTFLSFKFRKLVEIFYNVQKADVIDELHKIVHSTFQESQMLYENDKLVGYGGYLKERYIAEISMILPDWPPVQTEKIFNLAMIQETWVYRHNFDNAYLQMTITGKVDDILQMKRPIKLQDIFHIEGNKRRVILIEGAPGSGKTTLTLHICQKWGEGELFQEYMVVFVVQLRDPAVQSAQTIADLLPCRDTAMTEEMAAEITAKDGEGVLWILDGWDELPTHLQTKSFFWDLIYPPAVSPTLRSTVLVTSRPISATNFHSHRLWTMIPKRIEILGFTAHEFKLYLTECLKDDPPSVAEDLLEKINENPILESSCYLPLNAAVLAHVYRCCDYSLPNSQYELFLTITLNFMYRHIQKEGNHNDLLSLESFKDLPSDLTCHFETICKLAYNGMMENKVAFQPRNLPQNFNTLGLLQIKESLGLVGRSRLYHFHHLTFQELLAAYYIANNLTDEEQVQTFKELVKKPHYNMVFQFYAVITKLEKPGFPELVSNIASNSWLTQRLLPLLRCIHEVQDRYLCYFVAKKLQGQLQLPLTYLSTPDCLAIGYFLSHACHSGTFTANLTSSYIGNQGYKFLLRHLTSTGTGQLNLCLPGHQLGDDGLQSLAQFLQSTDSKALHSLTLGYNKHGDAFYVEDLTGMVTVDVLFPLSIALKTNCSIVEFSVVKGNLRVTETNGPALVEMLQVNRSLQILNFKGNTEIGDLGAFYIAEGLKRNSSVKILNISDCGLTAKGAELIANMLGKNKAVQTLKINRNNLSDVGIISLAHALISNASLLELNLANCHMTNTSLEVLGECLAKNSSLKVLRLGCDYYSTKVPTAHRMLQLAHHLCKRSVPLEQLKLSKNLVHSSVTNKLQENVKNVTVTKGNFRMLRQRGVIWHLYHLNGTDSIKQ